jgi:hypothetical protein
MQEGASSNGGDDSKKAATAFSIQVYTETTLQGGIFIKKMPHSTDSKR